MTAHLDLTHPSGELNQGQALAKYIRENPETWPQRYPDVYQRLKIIGFGAYFIFVAGLGIILLSQFQ